MINVFLSSWLFLIFVATPSNVYASELRDTFGRVSASIVTIGVTQKARPPISNSNQWIRKGELGSGVLVTSDGKVITAAHLVQTADTVKVQFAGGDIVDARVIASSPPDDVALLQLEHVPAGVAAAELGDSDEMAVGDKVFIVGAPFGFSSTLTAGHISAHHTGAVVAGGLRQSDYFQTDAIINERNSGGPMFNMDGKIIGIVNHALTPTGSPAGLGFVLTANAARQVLFENPSFWSGLDGYLLTETLAAIFNLPQPTGMLVQRVADSSPAARLGLRPGVVEATIGGETMMVGGDVILEIAGITLNVEPSTYDTIHKKLGSLTPGDTITVKVLRAGWIMDLKTIVTPAE